MNPFLVSIFLAHSLRRLKWNKKQLQDYQNQQMHKVVSYAYENVAFYHRLFKQAGLNPSMIKNLNDLNKIPLTRKRDLKKTPIHDLISKLVNMQSLKKITTGGSSGQPFSVYINNREDAWRKAIYLRANIACGQKIKDKWAVLIDEQYANSSSRLQKQLGWYTRIIVPVTLDRTQRARIVQEISPDILDGFPSALYLLAKDFEQNRAIKPRIIFGSGELVDKSTIKYLEKAFNAPYYDQFGCSEIDRSAWQCRQQDGYHMDIDSVLMQYVDKNGEEVSYGQEGEIVYTSLFNYAFPLIRYNIEDVGVPIADECSCGNHLPQMKVTNGRSNSFLVFPNSQIVSPLSFIETLGAFRLEKEIEQYCVIQEKTDYVRILVKKTLPEVKDEVIAKLLLRNLSEGLPDMTTSIAKTEFSIEFIDKIPCSARGKLSVITSHIPRAE